MGRMGVAGILDAQKTINVLEPPGAFGWGLLFAVEMVVVGV